MKLLRVLLRTKEKGLSFLFGVLLTRKVPSAESIFFRVQSYFFSLNQICKNKPKQFFAEKMSRQSRYRFKTLSREKQFSHGTTYSRCSTYELHLQRLPFALALTHLKNLWMVEFLFFTELFHHFRIAVSHQ